MEGKKSIRRALISVYHKDNLDRILDQLKSYGTEIISTGGTADFIESRGIKCVRVEDLTGYPSILGGRVKTLHPKIFGGILRRTDNESDAREIGKYEIPGIDLVIVDLYPFEETVASGACEADIIEKIDIGGISLIRAAAKNFNDVAIVASKKQYSEIYEILKEGDSTTLEQRRHLAAMAFGVSSAYDSAIFNYFDKGESALRLAVDGTKMLRYGENPHQKACFFGDFDRYFKKHHGKEISYNNILDIDSACALIRDFSEPTVAVIKHNNACGIASCGNIAEAWKEALSCDPVSAFGGVIVANGGIDEATASEINKIFFEVIIAPSYTDEALKVLSSKKNRIILECTEWPGAAERYRSAAGGILCQESDSHIEEIPDMKLVSGDAPDDRMYADLIFANKIVKHTKSNAIVLAKKGKLLASGTGQTSRVDSLRQAIEKAKRMGFDLNGAVMASDAFFPFSDCVSLADSEGIKGVVQPGGSIRDEETIEYCRAHGITMCMTGYRHFRH